jgi:hypothetical protein
VARNPARGPPPTSWPSGGAKWRQDLWEKRSNSGEGGSWRGTPRRRAALDQGEHGCDPGPWRRTSETGWGSTAGDDHGGRQAHADVAPSLDKAGADGEIGARPWGRSAGGEGERDRRGCAGGVPGRPAARRGCVTAERFWHCYSG